MASKGTADHKSKAPPTRKSGTGAGARGRSYFEYLVKYIRDIINFANDIILLLDEDLNVVEANDRALKAYGYTRPEIIGMPAISTVAAGDVDSFSKRIQNVRQNGEIRAEGIHRRKDGSTFPVEIASRNIKLGQNQYILANIRDITERKQAEQALRDSEERYRALVQQSLLGIGVSQGNRILFANQALLDIWGYETEEEYAQKSLLDHIAMSSSDLVAARMKQLAHGKTLEPTFEVDILRKDGQIRKLRATSSWINTSGQTYTQTVFEDITDRKQAEETLKESEERFRSLVESTSDWIWEINRNGVYTYASPKVKELLGYEPEEVIGKTPFDFMPDEEAKRIASTFSDLIAAQKPIERLENTCRHKNGNLVILETGGVPIFDVKGNLKGYRGIDRDITERKRAEETAKADKAKVQALVDGLAGTQIGIDIVGTDYKVRFQNQILEERFGDLAGKLCYVNYMGLDKPCDPCPMAEAIKAGKLQTIELTGADGRHYKLLSAPLPSPVGTVDQAIEVVMDITEQKQAERALRQSEEKYRSLVENAPDIVWSFSDKRGTIYASSRAKDILGYSPEHLYRNPTLWNKSIHPDDQPRVTQAIKDFASDKQVDVQYRIINASGDWLWFHDRSIGREEIDGEVVIHGISTDITERKNIEERVRVTNERLEYLVSSALVVMYSAEASGNYPTKFITRNVTQLTGYQPGDFLHNPDFWYAHVHPDDKPMIDSEVPKLFERGAHAYEYRFRRKDGEYIWVRDEMKLITDESGGPLEIIGAWSDITQEKLAQEALRQSEERYRTILEGMDDSYYEVDVAGNFTFVNDSLCRDLGRTKEQLIGMNYRVYTPEDKIADTFSTFNEVYRTGKPTKGIQTITITEGGTQRYVERSVFPLRNQKGEIVGFRGISRDITERKLAEEERKQLELKAQISSRLASVGEMAAGVAHEINNPLTGITGYAQLLLEKKDLPKNIKSDLEAINDGAQRVAGIVQRLLAFSRQTKPERKLVDINDLIESTLVLRAYHLRVNNIDVVMRQYPGLLQTVVDPGQIQQVLLNLIVNAETEMKLAHGKGKLTITTERTDNMIKVSVKDNGPGIKQEIMERIFDPFFTTREVGQGTGLGLSLCYGIMAEHNGRIYAQSHRGKGATFIVELPIITAVAPLKETRPLVKKRGKKVKASILVVDDEKVVMEIAKRVLSAEGHKVDISGNGVEALSKIKSKKYDLILLDIKMPGLNGIELYKRIQKTAPSVARRVVFMTGDIMGADTEKFLNKTGASHIEKPFDAEQLNAVVEHALSNVNPTRVRGAKR